MVRIPIAIAMTICLWVPGFLWTPGSAVAQQGDAFCGPVPAQPVCITPEEAAKPFASVEAADECQQAVRNYRDAVNLHVQCRTEETNAIVERTNEAIGRFNCRAEARPDCQETSQ